MNKLEVAIDQCTQIKTLYFGNGQYHVGLIRPENERVLGIHRHIKGALHISSNQARKYRLNKDFLGGRVWTPWDHHCALALLFYGDISGKVYVPGEQNSTFKSYEELYRKLSEECGRKLIRIEGGMYHGNI